MNVTLDTTIGELKKSELCEDLGNCEWRVEIDSDDVIDYLLDVIKQFDSSEDKDALSGFRDIHFYICNLFYGDIHHEGCSFSCEYDIKQCSYWKVSDGSRWSPPESDFRYRYSKDWFDMDVPIPLTDDMTVRNVIDELCTILESDKEFYMDMYDKTRDIDEDERD